GRLNSTLSQHSLAPGWTRAVGTSSASVSYLQLELAEKEGGGRRRPRERCKPICGLLRRTDLPDRARPRDLDQRAIAWRAGKMRIRAKIADGAIIDHISTAIWAKPDVGWPVEPVDIGHKRLVSGAITGEILDLQGER